MLNINSVWSIIDLEGVKDGKYRILQIFSSINCLIIFPINDQKSNKPILIDIAEFTSGQRNKQISLSNFDIPAYQQAKDSDIKSLHKQKRDIAYSLIEPFITNKAFLYSYSAATRSKEIIAYAKSKGIDQHKIYRALNSYWKYGQNINALLPAYSNSGGISIIRKDATRKRGRPHNSKFDLCSKDAGTNISEADRSHILKSFKKYCLKTDPHPVTHAYKAMLADYYPEEIERSEIYGHIPSVPSLHQYRYWSKKLVPTDTVLKKQISERKYNLNNRAILGSAVNNNHFPGTCYEIDATIADVHIVSEFRRNYCIGKPTIYAVTDKASRMITGIHVSLENASWKAARQALINAFTSKIDFCSRHGINITDDEWPCYHLPYSLLCDRGEMISDKAEKAVVPYMHLKIAPPYRADFKGIVERRFGLLNDELLHHLEGTTKGGKQTRGEIDPRHEAVYTLKEITTLIIQEVLTHNSKINKELAKETTLLIKHDLAPTPLNYWNIHTHENMHQLKSHQESDIRAKLLPKHTAYLTSRGVELNGLFYTCQEMEESGVFSTARSKGRLKVNARLDLDNTSEIYVQVNPQDNFIKCTLTSRSDAFRDHHIEDILFFNEWANEKEKSHITTSEEINRHKNQDRIKKQATKLQSQAIPLDSRKEKVIDIRYRRQLEAEAYDTKIEVEKDKATDTIKNIDKKCPIIKNSNNKTTKDSAALKAIKSNRRRNIKNED
jgi:predicted acetyltransferase